MEALHVVGNEFVEGGLFVGPSVESQFEFAVSESGALSVRDIAGSEAISISTELGGSVGVGISDPFAQLHVQGAGLRQGTGMVRLESNSVHGKCIGFLFIVVCAML